MAISANYPSPVMVNGFSCRNCTEVDQAKKHIDPKHPQDGPYGVNAKDHKAAVQAASNSAAHPGGPVHSPFATPISGPAGSGQAGAFAASSAPGVRLDITV